MTRQVFWQSGIKCLFPPSKLPESHSLSLIHILCETIKQLNSEKTDAFMHELYGKGAAENKARYEKVLKGFEPVSYTHLWKSDRRYFIPLPPKMAFYCVTFTKTAPIKRQGAEVIYWLPRPVLSVSYTHLDVYKRQRKGWLAYRH